MGERSYLSIGDVLALLREEFPDITISKIRFLESRGLLVPERTPSGYRKFYDHDVERLRWILRQQREHFLPLKVIKGRLEGAEGSAQPESLLDPAEAPPSSLSRAGAARASGSAGAHPSTGARLVDATANGSRVATIHRVEEREHDRAHPLGLAAAAAVTGGGREETARAHAAALDQPEGRTPHWAGAGATGSDPVAPARQAAAPAPSTPTPQTETTAAASGRGGAGQSRAPETPAPAPAIPEAPPAATPRDPAADGATFTPAELAEASGLSLAQIEELESFGLIEGRILAGVLCFDSEALAVARLAASFSRFGIEARHLRLFKHAAERQAGLYSQIVMPLLRQRNPAARLRAGEDLQHLTELGSSLQACFLRAVLRELTGG
ncbi:MAG TPA: MerR family transcriptional regulator [Acidimicrobiales bacterium]|nr:MerR family transcriptional regulator [Acidimicrobiales bacterium]